VAKSRLSLALRGIVPRRFSLRFTGSVSPFIDGSTELLAKNSSSVTTRHRSGARRSDDPFRLLDAYKCEATLMRTQGAATKLLDHVDGWQKVCADDIATIHLRTAGVVLSVDSALEPWPGLEPNYRSN
jgi:hypothetical protein